jgi:hypothetical protein
MEIIYTDKDGTTVKFTEEMAIAAITERDELRQKLNDCESKAGRYYSKLVTVREQVHEFFNSRYDVDTDTAIECEVDDVNELLRNIGAEELKKLWTVIGTIDFTVNNIYASNEEEANDYVMSELSAELGGDAELYDWAVDIKSTEQD